MSKLTPHQKKLKKLRADERTLEKVKYDSAFMAVNILHITLIYTMFYFYGWRNKRLWRALRQFRLIYMAVVEGRRSLEQLAEEIRHDAYIDFNTNTGAIRNLKQEDKQND